MIGIVTMLAARKFVFAVRQMAGPTAAQETDTAATELQDLPTREAINKMVAQMCV